MRAVIQRVNSAKVTVNGEEIASIGKGLVVYLGIGKGDTIKDAEYIIEKVINLRIFEDQKSHFSHSIKDINGEILIISQFTLYGDCRRGRRPSFDQAMEVDKARELYEQFLKLLEGKGVRWNSGKFQAIMEVESVNNGPVTILIDSKKLF